MSSTRMLLAGTACAALLAPMPLHAATLFGVTNLVSDGAVPAVTTDPSLVNPWGLARSATGPWWAADNGTGVSTLYNGAGGKLGLTVTIPPAPGSSPPSAPTGIVFNSTASGFQVSPGVKSSFIFDTEGGTIAAWAGSLGTNAITLVDRSAVGAIYKGLALGGGQLYAADFHNGRIDVFDSAFGAASGAFSDPGLGAGYAPFNVQLLGGELFVTYALQDADAEDEIHGAGLGYVDAFSLDGSFLRRIASPGSAVNAPWGLAIAPSTFGEFAGALLVGNFGDGTISAFNRSTGGFLGQLRGLDGSPLALDGLWALSPGNDGAAGSSGTLYFTAGLDDETHGLFGSLTAVTVADVPEPAAWALMILGFGLAGVRLRAHRRVSRA